MTSIPNPGLHEGFALKASWEVTAGVVPGIGIAELTKRWLYTSADFEEDTKHTSEQGYQPKFMKLLAEASFYQAQLTNPHFINWVQMSFTYY